MSFFSSLTQDIEFPTILQSTANINAAATFTSGWVSSVGYDGIKIILFTDQNCMVYVDQSSDGVHTDATDSFSSYASVGKALTDQITAKYVQVRVKNNGLSATTAFRLQSSLCPIANPLPTALSQEGNLKVGVYEIEGENGQTVYVTPQDALKVTESVRLCGTYLGEAPTAAFWTTTATGTGAVSTTGGETLLSTGATSASTVRLVSVRTARFVGSASNYFRSILRCPTATGANVRRWGAFDTSNGCFFELDNTLGFGIVTRNTSADTRVSTGSFNGKLGASYVLDQNLHVYVIIWLPSRVAFYIDGTLLHTVTTTNSQWSGSQHLKVGLENNNGANINNNLMYVSGATISRLGKLITQPQYAYINTLTTTTLKAGPGNLQSIMIGTVPSASGGLVVTVYDNTLGSGTVIGVFTIRLPASTTNPCNIDLKGIPFNTGLTIVTSGTAGDITVIFE